MEFTLDNKKYCLKIENDGIFGVSNLIKFVGYEQKKFLFIPYWSKCFSCNPTNLRTTETWIYEMSSAKKEEYFNAGLEKFKKYLTNNDDSRNNR